MSFINKVKNFFYEDIEEDDDEFEAREAAKREARFKKEEEKRRRDQEREQSRIMEARKKESKPANDNLSERELFKSERTFNFPMDLGDNIFDIEEEPKKEEIKEETRSAVKEEQNLYARPSRSNPASGIRTTYEEKPIKSELDDKKFHPSPVVSPVYGILDKNYTVDDVIDKNLSKTKEFSIEKKTVDFDTVRNRAYKELDEEIEATLTKTKDIFYNLDEEPQEIQDLNDTEETKAIEDVIEELSKNEENYNDDVVITYEGEEDEEKPEISEEVEEPQVEIEPEDTSTINIDEEEEDLTPDVEIPIVEEPVKEKRTRRSKKTVEDDVEYEEDKEDLFNLIDNMYNDEEDEEEED